MQVQARSTEDGIKAHLGRAMEVAAPRWTPAPPSCILCHGLGVPCAGTSGLTGVVPVTLQTDAGLACRRRQRLVLVGL